MWCVMLRYQLINISRSICKRRNLYYQYNYNNKVDELLNKQIQAEQQAAQDYLKLSVTFLHPSKSQFGAGSFFMKMYHEEIEHMQQFINYQIIRGGTILICGLEAPKKNNSLTLIDAFKQALVMEKTITKVLLYVFIPIILYISLNLSESDLTTYKNCRT